MAARSSGERGEPRLAPHVRSGVEFRSAVRQLAPGPGPTPAIAVRNSAQDQQARPLINPRVNRCIKTKHVGGHPSVPVTLASGCRQREKAAAGPNCAVNPRDPRRSAASFGDNTVQKSELYAVMPRPRAMRPEPTARNAWCHEKPQRPTAPAIGRCAKEAQFALCPGCCLADIRRALCTTSHAHHLLAREHLSTQPCSHQPRSLSNFTARAQFSPEATTTLSKHLRQPGAPATRSRNDGIVGRARDAKIALWSVCTGGRATE